MSVVAGQASGQAINPLWLGQWRPAETSQLQLPGPLRISSEGGATTSASGELRCTLVYDGTITTQLILQRLQERQAAQLDPQNWSSVTGASTDTRLLLGLRQEFEAAERMGRAMVPGTYKRVRERGPGCESEDDRFYLLSGPARDAGRIYRFNFYAASVGMEVTSFVRVK